MNHKDRISLLLCWLFLLLPTHPLLAKTSGDHLPVLMNEVIESLEISNHVGIFADENAQFSIKDVAKPEFDKFVLSDRLFPSYNSQNSRVWIKFTIANKTSSAQQYILFLDFPVLSAILYGQNLDGNSTTVVGRSGRKYVGHETGTVPSRLEAFELNLDSGQERTYYLALENDLVYLVKLSINKPKAYHAKERMPIYFAGIYAGAMIIMILYNLFLYFSTRDYAFLHYVLAVIFCHYGLFTMMYSSSNFLPVKLERFAPYYFITCRLLSVVFVVQFGRLFLKTQIMPRVDLALKACIWLSLAMFGLMPFMRLGLINSLHNLVTIPAIILLICVSGYLFSHGFRYARFYFIAWFPFIITAIGTVVVNQFQLTHLFPNVVLILLIAAASEVLLLSLALGDKINEMRKERANEQEAHRREVLALNVSLEKQVDEQTRDIKAMLDNIQLGVFAITQDFTVHKDYSKNLELILEDSRIRNRDIFDLLFEKTNLGPDRKHQIETALSSSLGDTLLNYEVNEGVLARSMKLRVFEKSKDLELDWAPIVNNQGDLDKILVTMRDVTEIKHLRELSRKQEDRLHIINELLNTNSERFLNLYRTSLTTIQNCHDILSQIDSQSVEAVLINRLFVFLHTIKGLSRSLNLIKISDAIHEAESFFDEVRNHKRLWDAEVAMTHLSHLQNVLADYHVQFEMLATHQQGISTAKFQRIGIDDLLLECFKPRDRLAREVGKEPPVLAVHIHESLELNEHSATVLRNCFVHLLRNTLIHGIEHPESRRLQGKPEAGRIGISIRTSLERDGIEITVQDDGAGLPLDKIRKRAIQLGLIAPDDQLTSLQLANLIFKPGLSTTDSADSMSGRGVGMDAIKTFLEAENAAIHIVPTSEVKNGHLPFQFLLKIPHTFFMSTDSSLPASA